MSLAIIRAVVALPYWWARNKLAMLFNQEARDAFEYAEGMRAEVEYYRRTTCAAAEDTKRLLADERERGYDEGYKRGVASHTTLCMLGELPND